MDTSNREIHGEMVVELATMLNRLSSTVFYNATTKLEQIAAPVLAVCSENEYSREKPPNFEPAYFRRLEAEMGVIKANLEKLDSLINRVELSPVMTSDEVVGGK